MQYISSGEGIAFATIGQVQGASKRSTTLTTGGNVQQANPALVAGTDGQVHKHVCCFGCNQYRHYQSYCPWATNDTDAQSRQQDLTIGFSFMQPIQQPLETVLRS